VDVYTTATGFFAAVYMAVMHSLLMMLHDPAVRYQLGDRGVPVPNGQTVALPGPLNADTSQGEER
jgi:hypothetical protein